MKRRWGLIITLLVILFLLASCGAAPSSEPQTVSSVGSIAIPDSVSTSVAVDSAPAQAAESVSSELESEAIYPPVLTYYESIGIFRTSTLVFQRMS